MTLLSRTVLPLMSQPPHMVPVNTCSGTSRQHLSQRPLHNLSAASRLTWLPVRLCCPKE